MITRKPVTERDMRSPEFRDCEPEDLEWRDDGTLARRDRWEQGIRQIAGIVGMDPRKGFEVADVVAAVRRLKVEPLGDDVTKCRLCGETIIATPDGSVCLGGHPK